MELEVLVLIHTSSSGSSSSVVAIQTSSPSFVFPIRAMRTSVSGEGFSDGAVPPVDLNPWSPLSV